MCQQRSPPKAGFYITAPDAGYSNAGTSDAGYSNASASDAGYSNASASDANYFNAGTSEDVKAHNRGLAHAYSETI